MSAQDVNDVRGEIAYRFITRTRYLSLPFAKTFKYIASLNTWKLDTNMWNERGKAMIITPIPSKKWTPVYRYFLRV